MLARAEHCTGSSLLQFKSSEETSVPGSSAGVTEKRGRRKKGGEKRLHCQCLGAVMRTRLHFTQTERAVKTGVLQPFPARPCRFVRSS